ncbi:MAG: hypothetical protein WC866_05905 [Patescibacteria group bacterium]
MTRLSAALYFQGSNLFGLRSWATKEGAEEFVHNAFWFNHAGELLGTGSLSRDDLRRISRELVDREMFIVVEEHVHRSVGMRHANLSTIAETVAKKVSFGTEYVAERSRYVIVPGKVYLHLDASDDDTGARTTENWPGAFLCDILSFEEGKRFVASWK